MNVVFWGTPNFAVPSLEALLADSRFQVLGVVTQPDKRRARGNQLLPSPVKSLAVQHQLPIWQPERVKKDAETLAILQNLGADIFVVVAYGQILSPEILAMPRWGCINNHGSLLPQYRGAAPIQWSIYNGETETGITTMQMDAGMDTGDMLLKAHLAIDPYANAQTVGEQLAQVGADLLIKTLDTLLAGNLQAIPQPADQATYAPLIKKNDYLLDLSRPAIALHNQVRGFYPDCYLPWQGQALKIQATIPLGGDFPPPPDFPPGLFADWTPDRFTAVPGTVLGMVKNVGLILQTGEGGLLLQSVQPPGKRSQSGWDFANGNRLEVGKLLV